MGIHPTTHSYTHTDRPPLPKNICKKKKNTPLRLFDSIESKVHVTKDKSKCVSVCVYSWLCAFAKYFGSVPGIGVPDFSKRTDRAESEG